MEKLDIIVLGVTGYTGYRVAECLAKVTKTPQYCNVTWGISGRSKGKLQKLLKELNNTGSITSKLTAIECDINNKQALRNVAQRAKILVNCTGPYEFLGETVVKCCIETGTHYVDISAELHNILSVYRKYDKAAEEANVLVLPACGFVAIPIIIGLMFLENHFEGTLKAVECYMELELSKRACFPGKENSIIRYNTWIFMVKLSKYMNEYKKLKKCMFRDPIEPEPEEIKRTFIHRNNSRFWYQYPGPDVDIVEMSQRYFYDKQQKRPVHFKMYATIPLLVYILLIPISFLYCFCFFEWFRKILGNYPRFLTFGYMSREGPSEKMRNETKFSFSLVGRGSEPNQMDSRTPMNKSMTLKVSGTDPCLHATATCLVCSVITLLEESSKMPKGGVIMPGAAFKETDIVNKLMENGIKYELIENN